MFALMACTPAPTPVDARPAAPVVVVAAPIRASEPERSSITPHRPPPPADLPDVADIPADAEYATIVTSIEAARRTFARYDARDQARAFVLGVVTERIIPAWVGTRWAFYGAVEEPSDDDEVACGYWVASVLRDAGFRVDRNHLGKQASEKILLTLVTPSTLRHYGDRVQDVIAAVTQAGAGLWGVGLSNHAGFLWNDGETVRFCHSNYQGFVGPMCEPAASSSPFRTSYTVIASYLGDATLDAWLAGRTLPTGRFTSPR